jgi:hypothetical protein
LKWQRRNYWRLTPKNNCSMGSLQISVNERKTGDAFVLLWMDMYSGVLFWWKDKSFHFLNVQRMDPCVFSGGIASLSDNVIMTQDCSTLPVLTPLWEIQANYANTCIEIGAAWRRKTSVIPEFQWVTSRRAGTGHRVTSTITEGRNVRGASIVPVFWDFVTHNTGGLLYPHLLNVWCLYVCVVRQGDIRVDRHKYTVSYWLFVVMKLLTS